MQGENSSVFAQGKILPLSRIQGTLLSSVGRYILAYKSSYISKSVSQIKKNIAYSCSHSHLKRVAVGSQSLWTRKKREQWRRSMATGSLNIRSTNMEWTRYAVHVRNSRRYGGR